MGQLIPSLIQVHKATCIPRNPYMIKLKLIRLLDTVGGFSCVMQRFEEGASVDIDIETSRRH